MIDKVQNQLSISSAQKRWVKWKRPLIGGVISALIAGGYIFFKTAIDSWVLLLLGVGLLAPKVFVDWVLILTPEASMQFSNLLHSLTLLFWFLAGFLMVHFTKKIIHAIGTWFLLLVVLFFSVLVSLRSEHNPQFEFKRLLSNPIPDGVSNITIKAGEPYLPGGNIDTSPAYIITFEATPKAIDTLISKNGFTLTLDPDYAMAPCDLFPELNCEQTWKYYTKSDEEYQLYWLVWINEEKSFVKVFFQQNLKPEDALNPF